MAVITRLGRLFRADVHAALDRLEEPDLLLRQSIREMEEELAHSSQQLKAREAESRDLQVRRDELGQAQRAIGGELDLCFNAGNEVLQRMLLRRRLTGERLSAQWAQRFETLNAAIVAQRQQLDEQRRQLEGLRERAAIFERTPAAGEVFAWHPNAAAVTDADVELALLRERALRGGS
jgi:phage shock protein A